jgi:hypothetical protein
MVKRKRTKGQTTQCPPPDNRRGGHKTITGATSEAGTAYPFGAPKLIPRFSGVRVTRSLVLYVCFVDRCLSFIFWPLCSLFFFDIRTLINPLVSQTLLA